MRTDRLRAVLIALLAAAAVLAVVGRKLDAAWVVWLSYAPFFVAVVLLVDARRRIARRRHDARVFDREAKTSETRTRPDE
ncbi:MAG TPA: hypothetical protein VFA19_12585 [Gaiellaceae bacterium]|nr:hypothetical protein [Gaiellaceae bacterium]